VEELLLEVGREFVHDLLGDARHLMLINALKHLQILQHLQLILLG
jgi:hypothetical protein